MTPVLAVLSAIDSPVIPLTKDFLDLKLPCAIPETTTSYTWQKLNQFSHFDVNARIKSKSTIVRSLLNINTCTSADASFPSSVYKMFYQRPVNQSNLRMSCPINCVKFPWTITLFENAVTPNDGNPRLPKFCPMICNCPSAASRSAFELNFNWV